MVEVWIRIGKINEIYDFNSITLRDDTKTDCIDICLDKHDEPKSQIRITVRKKAFEYLIKQYKRIEQ